MSGRKGRRQIVGVERKNLAADLAARYLAGEDTPTLAASIGRSRGFVRNVLRESGVQLRPRGGARPNSQGLWAVSITALAATLAAQHPGEPVSFRLAAATLRRVHGACSDLRARQASARHNERLAASGDMRPPTAGRRVNGYERQVLIEELVERYEEGESITDLAADVGKVYTTVYRMLVAGGAQFRAGGGVGNTRSPVANIRLRTHEFTLILEGLRMLKRRNPAITPSISRLAAKVRAARDREAQS